MQSLWRSSYKHSKRGCTLYRFPTTKYSTKPSEYLKGSRLPTYHFQKCLPRLPIPKLEDTMSRYLQSVKALEGHPNIDQYAIRDTERSIKSFLLHDGPEIHEVLVSENARNSHTSYITKPWFDMYLESRIPLPLNYNPFLVFNPDPNPAMNDQATRSTNLIVSSMKFHKTLNARALSPEVFYMKDTAKSAAVQNLVRVLPNAMMLRYLPMAMSQAYPLDMSQFGNLLSSTRIPVQDKDELKTCNGSRHVLVLRNGHFYKVNALDANGNILAPSAIKGSIEHILTDDAPRDGESIAYMTSTERNTWAKVRNHLLATGNQDALDDVDSAIFCLVLEGHVEKTAEGYVDMFLHGDGTSRWFDKSFSLIVSANGEVGLNFEHAWGDGVAVMRYFNDVFDDSTLTPSIGHDVHANNAQVDDHVTRIKFHLDDFAKQAISDARSRYDLEMGRLRVASCEFPQMNKDYLKKKKVSPDGILQLAIQAGHYKLCGHPAATYESCSTSAFKHGRTETIRSCTLEAQEAAKALCQAKLAHDSEYRMMVEQLIRKSCNKHNELTKQAATGQGFDRHMFGLRHTAEKLLQVETPGIFKDPNYVTMNHIVLSTSTLSSHAVSMGGFAPVVPDGFGVGYGVRDHAVGCNITSYDNRDVKGLVECIDSSLNDIYTVLENSK